MIPRIAILRPITQHGKEGKLSFEKYVTVVGVTVCRTLKGIFKILVFYSFDTIWIPSQHGRNFLPTSPVEEKVAGIKVAEFGLANFYFCDYSSCNSF